MPKYIFAPLTAVNTHSGWQTHPNIGNLADGLTDGLRTANSVKIGSSIPTPFARIHLFDTAFGNVKNAITPTDDVKSYHQLVSDCIDLLELLSYLEIE